MCFCNFVAPPAYDSVFGKIKAARQQSTGAADFGKSAGTLIFAQLSGVCGLVLLVLCCAVCALGLPIAEITIGMYVCYTEG